MGNLIKPILLIILIGSSFIGSAQVGLDYKLDGSENGKSLVSFLDELERKNIAQFYFHAEWIESISFQKSYKNQTLKEALDDLFAGSDLNYLPMYPSVVIIMRGKNELVYKDAIKTALIEKKKIDRKVFGELGKSRNKTVVITGHVFDSKTHEPISRANLTVINVSNGSTTNEKGAYSLSIAPGSYVLNFSFVNYESKIIDLTAYADGELNIELEEVPTLLQEVIIQSKGVREIATGRIGQTQIVMSEIKRAPALLGEVDLVKQVQTLPGVTTVGEAAAGFNVRGGSVDQNLILYDGIPVFNSSHVFGFFSAFNSEAIHDVSFFRGGIPAEYGGRASSVLDIQSKNGDFQKWNGNVGIGLITSNLMVNGPLKKDKTSLFASFRTTYSNYLIRAIDTNYADLSKSSVFFYDGTLKLSHKFSDNTNLSVTGYSSQDAFSLGGDSTYRWNNFQVSAKLDHKISDKLNAEFVAGVSSYGYNVVSEDDDTAFKLSYRITTSVLKAGFNYDRGDHKINFGWQLMHYGFDPGRFEPNSSASNANRVTLDKQNSIENAFYVGDEWSLSEKLFLEAGFRVPFFSSYGSASINTYKENAPLEIQNVTDTLHFAKGETIKTYFGFEPRISIRWMVQPTASLKLGYSRVYQYLHLISNSTAVTPVDIWQPSGYYFKPQDADQISLGYFIDLSEKKYSASAEVFYKSIKNIVDFKDGAQLILNTHLETDLLQGKGYAYGVETFLSKNTGRLTGSVNYTYSRSFRLIDGPTSSESINQGKKYPSNFDQPHVLNFSWKYNLSRRLFFTGSFTYHTGRPVTIPVSAFKFEGTTVAYFSSRNQYRIPDYHRLDIALIIEGNHKREKKVNGTWVISVYNVYGRNNPYTIFFAGSSTGIPEPYQLSIIGTIFPSVSYNLKF